MLPLGNALLVVASLVPDPDPGHSTGRSHDVENVLLTRLEKQIADKAAEMAKHNDRNEERLTKLAEDFTALLIQLSTARRMAEVVAR